MKVLNRNVSVIGLGYVGLPVAVAFGTAKKTIAFDINCKRVEELVTAYDRTGELTEEELRLADIIFTSSAGDLRRADFHIVAVPTPLNDFKQPDLTPLFRASETVGQVLKKGDVVVYESTVYPGVTEGECVPILERVSGLKCGHDFKVGYSPERINPGDREHSFTKITKVVSGQDEETLDIVAEVYSSVVKAGVFRAASIKVAEAAKVIENTQRDLNVALMNELALIFDRLGIDTNDVLAAAGTKWNFLAFKPGLVGGHCIGVDPYYLTHKAEQAGYLPQVILAGRRINDSMGEFIARRTVKEMVRAGRPLLGNTVTILGITFKEDCPDLRNSKVVNIIRELEEYGLNIQVHDPLADSVEVEEEYGVSITEFDDLKPAAAVVAAVPHRFYRSLSMDVLMGLMVKGAVFADVKGVYNRVSLKKNGVHVWRL